ncbi:MFS transporter [Salmonella enterica]|uniref:MFS transporter n=1 Tax=Salmonella enterica TaxID=28901 RepID=UPI0034CF1644
MDFIDFFCRWWDWFRYRLCHSYFNADEWFPERQGLATGLAIMGFGFGAFLGGPIMTWIISVEGISFTFYLLGCVYCLIIIVSACYLSPPPENGLLQV